MCVDLEASQEGAHISGFFILFEEKIVCWIDEKKDGGSRAFIFVEAARHVTGTYEAQEIQ
jgi:hypothetical protein